MLTNIWEIELIHILQTRKIAVKKIIKLAQSHTANKPKNQNQRPLPPNNYKTKQEQKTNKPKQEQQLQPIKALAMCFYHMYVLHVYTFVYR